jgi:probable F420-dependent oxidoreductase
MVSTKRAITFGLAFGARTPKLSLTRDNWKEVVTQVEVMGYSGIFIPDHFIPQWDPIAAMAAIAAITEHVDIGSMVFCNDFRHPVIHAKASATLNLISKNRHIFGIGAGWMESDYVTAGIPLDNASTRIERMVEAIKIIRGMWTQESTSFEGKHYHVKNLPKVVGELEFAKPRLMIGGGGPTMLKLAGRYADIANIAFTLGGDPETRFYRAVLDGSYERLGEKVDTISKSAESHGRDPGEIVYSQWIGTRRMFGDPVQDKRDLAKRFGTSVEEISDCTWMMVGEPGEVVESFRKRYDEYGISHYIVDAGDSPSLADLRYLYEKVIKPLS